jgi:hypothetical protein
LGPGEALTATAASPPGAHPWQAGRLHSVTTPVPGHNSDLEAKTQRVYALTDRLQVQLRVLEESHASVHQTISWSQPGEGVDIEALAFLVLMDASKSAQEDLREIMESVEEINAAGRGLRPSTAAKMSHSLDTDSILKLMLTIYWKELDDEVDSLQRDVDANAELSELESLRLQMAMDRISKMMATLSNLLKKLAETNSSIVQNLK